MRRLAREIALQILFQTEFAPQMSLNSLAEVYGQSFDESTMDYALQLIRGVQNNQSSIDGKIQASSNHWKLDRMATIDRNILRIAVFEMAIMTNPLKSNIVINEAVEIAKKFSTTDSAGFINGLLDQIAKGH